METILFSEYFLVFLFVSACFVILNFERLEGFETMTGVCDEKYYEEIDGFLTDVECDILINDASNKGFVKSEVGGATENDPIKLDPKSRNSEQTWFAPGEHDVIDKIQNKTRELLDSKRHCIDKYKFEDVQVARYKSDQYYYHHYDGDDCDDACPKDQRLATLMVYLKEPNEGGETDFPTLKTKIIPKKGKAIFFWVADPVTRKLYKETLHAGLPVKSGEKIIANQWIRAL
ncbi:prolyl 4-hydroxylase [Paramecium bursaria Chlorella virus NYs1]|uniref:Prolyl 4-hydroxylase n=1 Tax=Paramecium bursaria Chlorella virus NYs1 TaxID=83442 RepID=M1HH58_9PHYC|nr:prolyl 4-hydroxylase [Paramecium bursaria Chlorella virus NYs1]AGE54947.1 prolyl 4-hydroxylase [Paramecium bursaria Chlorella virus MA1D]AGE58608.1 prolyl 4-hydroxylase [Paramecium bursaria Chlorella virus NYs1]